MGNPCAFLPVCHRDVTRGPPNRGGAPWNRWISPIAPAKLVCPRLGDGPSARSPTNQARNSFLHLRGHGRTCAGPFPCAVGGLLLSGKAVKTGVLLSGLHGLAPTKISVTQWLLFWPAGGGVASHYLRLGTSFRANFRFGSGLGLTFRIILDHGGQSLGEGVQQVFAFAKLFPRHRP